MARHSPKCIKNTSYDIPYIHNIIQKNKILYSVKTSEGRPCTKPSWAGRARNPRAGRTRNPPYNR